MERARERAGRPPGSVRLLAVTKTVEAERVRRAWDAGVRLFGESYVQEAVGKVDRLPPEAEWHFIGHLQSNKARQALDLFRLVHSLDRPSLADALEKAARARGAQVDVLLEVNVGAEASKSGASLGDALDLARRAEEWPSLRIRGLMAIPPYLADAEEVRPYFRAVRELADRIRALELPGVAMEELSMGMSHDFPVAIEEGATLVRVGTALFGERA
ncbi:MAG: YggS family pyridoxal phosphate-dependent enzyme [Deltaproteobacteria bacterium]|nr:YggS family pyridoxal phosphate-dependent enzyme [Deltaproteobacteria bacterium]